MTIQIHIDTATAEEAIGIMRAFIASMTPAPAVTASAVEITPPAKGRKAAAPKKAPESEITDLEPVSEPEVPKVEEPKAETPEPTADEVRDAIRSLGATHGENACWAILKKYKAGKRSEVKDTRAFIKEINELNKLTIAEVVERVPGADKPPEHKK